MRSIWQNIRENKSEKSAEGVMWGEKSTMKIGLETVLRGWKNKCEVNVERRDSTVAKREKREGNEGEMHFFKCSVRFWDQSCSRQEASAMQSAWWMRRSHGCWGSTNTGLHLLSTPSPRPLGHCRTHFISRSLFFPFTVHVPCPHGIYESDLSRPWWIDFLCTFCQFTKEKCTERECRIVFCICSLED